MSLPKKLKLLFGISVTSLNFILTEAPNAQFLTQAQRDSGWVELFNGKDWTGVGGSLGNDATGNGWKNFFKIIDSGIVQVPTTPSTYGYIETDKDYSRYIVRSQYKFYNNPKNGDNSGLLYHCSGPMPGGNEWPATVEFQYKLGEGGRLWIMKGPRIKSYTKDDKYTPLSQGGTVTERGGGGYQTVPGRLVNNKMNDWNDAELRVYGSDSSVHILNGEVIFRGHDIQNENRTPRTQGRIRLQAEGAGIYHRNWMIMELDANGKAKNAKTPTALFKPQNSEKKPNRATLLTFRGQTILQAPVSRRMDGRHILSIPSANQR